LIAGPALTSETAERLRDVLLQAASSAAASSHGWRGKGDKNAADGAAVAAMRRVLAASGDGFRVVSGEGLLDQAPRFDQGEQIGEGTARWDMAVDPLDGTSLCASNLPGAICALGVARQGSILPAPDMYMWKLMAGPDCPAQAIHPGAEIGNALRSLAEVKGCPVQELTVSMLDRKRHWSLMEQVRAAGAGLRLIDQGDLLAAEWVCRPGSGVDLHVGIGGAPEGVISAMILKALGGHMAARLIPQSEGESKLLSRGELARWPTDNLTLQDIVREDAVVAVASVTGTDSLAAVMSANGGLSVEAQTWSTMVPADQRQLAHRSQQDATQD
jgi:fructose-1,6-bisphosphatase/sedoheptulose 1,7-bisphosphatase-like protein